MPLVGSSSYCPYGSGIHALVENAKFVADFPALLDLIQSDWADFLGPFDPASVHVKPYGYDPRVNWNTHLITIDGYGVWGMTSGPVDGSPEGSLYAKL